MPRNLTPGTTSAPAPPPAPPPAPISAIARVVMAARGMLARSWVRVVSLPRMVRHQWTHSLRVRLALWYGALMALVLVLFGIGVYLLMSQAIAEGSRAEVQAESRVAQAEIRRHLTDNPPFWPAHLALDTVDANRQPGVSVMVLNQTGRMLYSSGDVGLLKPPITSPLLTPTLPAGGEWRQVTVDGERLLLLALPVNAPASAAEQGQQGPIGVLLVAKSLRDANATLATLSTLLVIGGALAIAGALAGGGIIARGVLRPLSEVTATAGSIATATASGTRIGNLSQRVRPPRSQDELAQLVETFNTMLASLERATSSQQRFVQDASHELRVPLTIVQGNLTLLLEQGARMPEPERAELLTAAQEETVRLTGLVNELLALARADSARGATSVPGDTGAPSLATGPRALVDLDRIVLDLARRMRSRLAAEQSPLELKIVRVEPVQIRGNEEGLRKVGFILLDNAVKYTQVQTGQQSRATPATVSISLERRGDHATLRIRDTGIGITPEDLPHIFDRLYRADLARDRQGSGLGLAIAKAIVEQHGGSISATSTPGHGSAFTVRLPLADPPKR